MPVGRVVRIAIILLTIALPSFADRRLDSAMDAIVTRLYASMSVEQLRGLTEDQLAPYITPKTATPRHRLLAVRRKCPVVSPSCATPNRRPRRCGCPNPASQNRSRREKQKCIYEVWQKKFGPGHVALGINGLDGHRFCYFVCVGPRAPAPSRPLNVTPAVAPQRP